MPHISGFQKPEKRQSEGVSYETAAWGTLEFRVSVWEKQCQGNLRKAFLGGWGDLCQL